jgi:ubiquinone/menaquinone biosynthesis C-methylase UbiE
MSKSAEKAYLKNIGEDAQIHAFNKPYSDARCGCHLMDIGLILSLLPSPPGKLLDLGVGTGWTSVFFAQRGYDVTGQDIADDMIAFAEKNKIRNNFIKTLQFISCDYETLPFSNEFDYAIFYDSLHHSDNIVQAITAVYRALKPNGILIAIEPGRGHSKTKAAKIATSTWGVTERDMPPSLIIRIGKKAGFKKAKVYWRVNRPFEVFPYITFKEFLIACKYFLKYFPGIGTMTSNITVLRK